jgi:hypothetical protein
VTEKKYPVDKVKPIVLDGKALRNWSDGSKRLPKKAKPKPIWR